jgi:hypothetical protein
MAHSLVYLGDVSVYHPVPCFSLQRRCDLLGTRLDVRLAFAVGVLHVAVTIVSARSQISSPESVAVD